MYPRSRILWEFDFFLIKKNSSNSSDYTVIAHNLKEEWINTAQCLLLEVKKIIHHVDFMKVINIRIFRKSFFMTAPNFRIKCYEISKPNYSFVISVNEEIKNYLKPENFSQRLLTINFAIHFDDFNSMLRK